MSSGRSSVGKPQPPHLPCFDLSHEGCAAPGLLTLLGIALYEPAGMRLYRANKGMGL